MKWTPALIQKQAFIYLIADEPARTNFARQMLVNSMHTKTSTELLYLRVRLQYKLGNQRDA
jgi:hypothetical protein